MFAEPALLVSRLIFIGLLIEALEVVALRGMFADDGMFSRSNLGVLTAGTRWQMRILADTGASASVVAAMAIQFSTALVVIVDGVGEPVGIAAALCCLATGSYMRSRRQIGGSGAEQLTFIALVAFAVVIATGGSRHARQIGDAFLAAQVTLAYTAAGVAKLASPVWRSGTAMTGILSTEGYGRPRMAELLVAHPLVDRLMCWTVVAWEVTFPLAVVAPRPVLFAYLATGAAFHISCAVMMGLNRFVWAFCGCYPAVWATATLLR